MNILGKYGWLVSPWQDSYTKIDTRVIFIFCNGSFTSALSLKNFELQLNFDWKFENHLFVETWMHCDSSRVTISRGGGILQISSDGGWSKDFWRVWNFDSGIFWGGRKIWQVSLFWWLDLSRVCFGVFKTISRFVVVPAYDIFIWYHKETVSIQFLEIFKLGNSAWDFFGFCWKP